MTKGEALQVLEVLSDFYDKSPPRKQLEAWIGKIGFLDFSDAMEAADSCTSNMALFPTPAKFFEFADQCRARRSERNQCRERSQATEFLKPDKHNPGLARDAVIAINRIMELSKTTEGAKQEFEIVGKLAEKYPHLDWQPHFREILKRKKPEALGLMKGE